jgi:hypothetical protein
MFGIFSWGVIIGADRFLAGLGTETVAGAGIEVTFCGGGSGGSSSTARGTVLISSNCGREGYRDRGAVGSGVWTKSSAGLMN